MKCEVCGRELDDIFVSPEFHKSFSNEYNRNVIVSRGVHGVIMHICLDGNKFREPIAANQLLECFKCWDNASDEMKKEVERKVNNYITNYENALLKAEKLLSGLSSLERNALVERINRNHSALMSENYW